MEGLVKAGCFDEIEENRQSLYNSIPNIILKSKNIFENAIVSTKRARNQMVDESGRKRKSLMKKVASKGNC